MSKPTNPKKLLVVDWDYFFRNAMDAKETNFPGEQWMYDWGHRESNFHINALWSFRAADFARNGIELPRTTGEEKGFLDRFTIKPSASLYVADSNLWAIKPQVRRDVDEVWLYDAHHDSGYREGILDQILEQDAFSWECGSWMLFYHLMGADLHMRYPNWCDMDREHEPEVPVDRDYDDYSTPDVSFDRVYICRSGAWTPPWIDEQFFEFTKSHKFRRTINIDGVEARPWGQEEKDWVDQHAAAMHDQHAAMQALKEASA